MFGVHLNVNQASLREISSAAASQFTLSDACYWQIPCDGGAMTFEEFAAGRLPAVIGFATVLAGDRASAEDIVQEVPVRAYLHWDRIGGLDRPESYVRKMVVNEFLSSRRRSWRLVPSGRGSDLGDRPAPDLSGCYAELAEILGCTPVTVRKCASRALATLRIELSADSVKEQAPVREASHESKGRHADAHRG
jgi:DNA-directed RNA polymerase specialized sigma24 family protein